MKRTCISVSSRHSGKGGGGGGGKVEFWECEGGGVSCQAVLFQIPRGGGGALRIQGGGKCPPPPP